MAATLAGVVRALGGQLYAGGLRACVPGPGHGPVDRSVSLRLLPDGRVLIHSFAGDDWRKVREELARLGLLDPQGRLAGGGCGAPAPPEPPSDAARRRIARALWEEGRPLAGSLSERHLRARGVARPLGPELRHHPEVPSCVYEGRGRRRPALLAAVRGPDGELAAVEVCYLAPSGARACMRTPRKLIGAVPPGSAVRLDPPAEALLVAEGVATALSASERFGLPAWALLSAGRLARWRPPAEVRRVLVAADRGHAGEAAAQALVRALAELGVAAEAAAPPPAFGDWNDVAAAGEGGGTGPGEPVRGGWSDPGGPETCHDP